MSNILMKLPIRMFILSPSSHSEGAAVNVNFVCEIQQHLQ